MTTPNDVLFRQASPDKVMPIYNLWRAVCRWFYDEDHCPLGFRSEIEKEICKWDAIIKYQKKIRLESFGPQWQNNNPVGQKGNVIDELEYQIGKMCQWIVFSDTGVWNSPESPPIKADTVRIHQMDYRRIVDCKRWFPDAQDPEGPKRAQAYLKEAMKDNPQDYQNNEHGKKEV